MVCNCPRSSPRPGCSCTFVRRLLAVSERISADAVAKVARLARLDVTDDELQRMTGQLAGMLEHFADIDALDLSTVTPMTQPYPLVNVLRPDVVQPCLDRDEVLAAAPATEDGRFRVPPIIGIEG
jgi:aspartyl-tRNA(Asn)/glutamyl-tRNA(Gln) amidotransferase subunit C